MLLHLHRFKVWLTVILCFSGCYMSWGAELSTGGFLVEGLEVASLQCSVCAGCTYANFKENKYWDVVRYCCGNNILFLFLDHPVNLVFLQRAAWYLHDHCWHSYTEDLWLLFGCCNSSSWVEFQHKYGAIYKNLLVWFDLKEKKSLFCPSQDRIIHVVCTCKYIIFHHQNTSIYLWSIADTKFYKHFLDVELFQREK